MYEPYISIKKDGEEIYAETVPNPFRTQLGAFIDLAKEKLKKIKEAMPEAKWSATIERQLPRKHGESAMDAKYIVLDVETGRYICGAESDKVKA